MMKTITFVLLMTFFASSCNTVVRKAMCKEITKYQVDMVDSYVYRKGRCYSAPFNVNSWQDLQDYVEVPLENCDGIQGVKVTFGISEIKPKFTALQRIRENACQ